MNTEEAHRSKRPMNTYSVDYINDVTKEVIEPPPPNSEVLLPRMGERVLCNSISFRVSDVEHDYKKRGQDWHHGVRVMLRGSK